MQELFPPHPLLQPQLLHPQFVAAKSLMFIPPGKIIDYTIPYYVTGLSMVPNILAFINNMI